MGKATCENCGNKHENLKDSLKKIVSFIKEAGYEPAIILMTKVDDGALEILSMMDKEEEGIVAIGKFIKTAYKENWFKNIVQHAVLSSIEDAMEFKIKKDKVCNEKEENEE